MCRQRGFAPAKLCVRDGNEEFIKWTTGAAPVKKHLALERALIKYRCKT